MMMTHRSLRFGLFGLAALLLAACGARRAPAPIFMPTLAGPIYPTVTAAPSPGLFTAIHSQVTYVPTRTPQPTKTRTLTPTLTQTFMPTLTPATPAVGPEGYRLKAWTFQDAMTSIAEAEGILVLYDWQNWISPYDFDDFREYLIAIEREALLRFSNAPAEVNVDWKLAYQEASRGYAVDHFKRTLEEALNSSQVHLDELTRWLPTHGFEIVAQYTVENLLGPDHSALVLHIKTLESPVYWGESSGIFIISELPQGSYHILPLHDQWIGTHQNNMTVAIADRNSNGQLEIQEIDDSWTVGFPNACGSRLFLFEYQGTYPSGNFMNLAQKVASVGAGSDYGECLQQPWKFGQADGTGAPSITGTIQRFLGGECLYYDYQTTYIWSDGLYVWTGESSVTPTSKVCAMLWAEQTGGLDDTAFLLFVEALDNWPVGIDSIWGPSAQDYFRFKLGTWYALRGEIELAQSTLQTVIDHPVNPNFDLASRMAAAYLDKYQNGQNPTGACRAAIQTIENARPDFSESDLGGEREYLQQMWGFAAPDWRYYPYNVCDPAIIFQNSILPIAPKGKADIIQWFRERELPAWAVEQGDLNGDGLDDWVVLVKISGERAWDLWALIQDREQLRPVLIECCHITHGIFFAALSQIQINSAPVNVFTLGETATAFQIVQTSEGLKSVWFPPPISTTQTPPLLSQGEKIEIIEATLFESNQIAPSIEMVQALLAGQIFEPRYCSQCENPARVRPYLLYLLALAHELSGHEREAVQAYWQLWHDYPDSPYTLIARRKLEALAP